MPFLMLLLLALPIAEIVVMVHIAHALGWITVLGFFLLSAVLGFQLLRLEKKQMFGQLALAFATRQLRARTVLAMARWFIAGILFIIPGFITEVIALGLLFWPVPKVGSPAEDAGDARAARQPRPQGDVLEGEFRRVDD